MSTTENVQEAAAAAAEKLAEAAAAATSDETSPGEDAAGELLGGEVDQWSFLTKAIVAVVVIVAFLIANKVIRGETPEEKRQRLRNERRAQKKAAGDGPDEIDRLLSSIVRRQPGQAPPPGSVPVSGRGAGRGMPPGAAGRGAGPAGAAAAMRTAAAARAAAAGGRGNGTGPAGGRGPPPPPGAADNRPKLRWDQSNEEVEIIIRVDPKVVRSDVKVEVTGTALKLYLRNQPIIAGHLFQPVDPEGCTWQIDNPGPGHPKEVTITLLKAEPAKNRESWWRAPLKGLENRRPAPKPADPEMVRKAIEAIKAKSAAGGGGAKLSAKPGLAAAGVGAGGRQQVPPGSATAAAPGNGTTARAAPSAPGGSASSPASAASAAATAGRSPGAKAGAAGAGGGGGDAGAKAVTAAGSPASATQPSQKTGKSGKKKNRKKK
ncbi:unnamed protein product [Pylaiella littoralis]